MFKFGPMQLLVSDYITNIIWDILVVDIKYWVN